MKKHTQWLQYLTALSLTRTTPTLALGASPSMDREARISAQAAEKLNGMAEKHASSTDQNAAELESWLQWIEVWLQWTRIIIIIIEQQADQVSESQDFGSYGELLDRVKTEA
jgi:hypothetical protein